MNSEKFGHPKGLFILFFTEMWERFSYYGMKALLILYMTDHLFVAIKEGKTVWGYDATMKLLTGVFGEMSIQAQSSQIYGIYTGLVYFTPFFGGLIADQWLGKRRSVYLGGVLMMIGHFLMAIESAFFPALSFLILGNGFFKPNISTQVGDLYPVGDTRRDRAFTIFYMGINLGAFFSPLVCGTLGQKVGWHYGFGAAGVGMFLGLMVYHFGRHHLPKELKHSSDHPQAAIKQEKLNGEDWQRIFALFLLAFVNIAFWAVFEQQGNTLQLWADRKTDWVVLGWEMPSTWLQAFNPFFIFAFAPLIDMLWASQSKKGTEPRSVVKMALGCFMAGAAFLIMAYGAHAVPADQKGSVMWLIACVFVFTMGELYLSPIGLSLVTKIAPKKILSMMMGVWFLSSFFGNYAAGYLGAYYEKMTQVEFFNWMAALAGGAGLIFVLAAYPLRKLVP